MGMTAKLEDIGIDWLTLTSKESTRGVEWHEAFAACASLEQAKGHKWLNARRMMYVGESCSGCFWGRSEQGWMVVLSGHCAQDYATLFEPDAVHCTRVDLQVTLSPHPEQPLFIEKTYEACAIWRPMNGRPPKYGIVKDTEGGRTLYVGSRTSLQFGRLYDKGIEQKAHLPGSLLRYELEIKAEYADQAIALLWGEADTEGVILHLLKDFFEQRHVPCPWTARPGEYKFVAPAVTPDDAGSLKWLRGPVATVVERLLATVGADATMAAILHKSQHLLTDAGIVESVAALCDG